MHLYRAAFVDIPGLDKAGTGEKHDGLENVIWDVDNIYLNDALCGLPTLLACLSFLSAADRSVL